MYWFRPSWAGNSIVQRQSSVLHVTQEKHLRLQVTHEVRHNIEEAQVLHSIFLSFLQFMVTYFYIHIHRLVYLLRMRTKACVYLLNLAYLWTSHIIDYGLL